MGKLCWLTDPVGPRVFWVITGFGIHSAGRGHAVETGVPEPVPRWGPILLLSVLLVHSVLPPPPPVCRLQCLLRLVKAKPLPLRNSLPPFHPLALSFPLFSFSLFVFSFSLSFIFNTPNIPPSSSTSFMLFSCHIIGLDSHLFDKNSRGDRKSVV